MNEGSNQQLLVTKPPVYLVSHPAMTFEMIYHHDGVCVNTFSEYLQIIKYTLHTEVLITCEKFLKKYEPQIVRYLI